MKQLSIEEQQTQCEAIERMQRTPGEVAASVDPADAGGGKSEFSPISGAEMRGTPIAFERNGLKLMLTPLKRRQIRDSFTPLLESWPTVLQFAASLKSPVCAGIDYPGVALAMSSFSLAIWKITDDEAAEQAKKEKREHNPADKPQPVTEYDVLDMIGSLQTTFDAYLGDIADTVWLLAKGSPGVAWPRPDAPDTPDTPEGEKGKEAWNPEPPAGCQWLDDALDDALEIPDFADLLRALFAANGRFRGSLQDRFITG